MNGEDFAFLSDLIKRRSGLVLTPDKAYLVEGRLGPVARRLGLGGLDALVARLRVGAGEDVLAQVAEAMTTNESFFFRDTKPFEQFRTIVMPELLLHRAGSRRIRIWSAAAATGQEAYSLAMCLDERRAELDGWRVEILATDLSTEALSRAREGRYTQFEVQRGLPIQKLVRHFTQEGTQWRIRPELRQAVVFERHNLLGDNARLGLFDVIFCRNVLIYFDLETKTRILAQMARMLPEDGFLFLGGTESVLGICDRFESSAETRGLYRQIGYPRRLAAAG